MPATMTSPSEPRTLQGLRVLLTRSAEDNRAWAAELEARGAAVEALACLETTRLPAAPKLAAAGHGATWLVLGSRRAVDAVAELEGESGLTLPPKVACVGPATERAARERLGRCDLVAGAGTMASLAADLGQLLGEPTTLVLACADRAGRELEDLLVPAGHAVRRVPVYTTRPAPPTAPAAERPQLEGFDAVVLGSPSALEGLLNQRRVPRDLPLVTLGPTTSAAARAAGLGPVTEAETRDLAGVAAALARLAD
jgi:uroporphyrinogen-III synthase